MGNRGTVTGRRSAESRGTYGDHEGIRPRLTSGKPSLGFSRSEARPDVFGADRLHGSRSLLQLHFLGNGDRYGTIFVSL